MLCTVTDSCLWALNHIFDVGQTNPRGTYVCACCSVLQCIAVCYSVLQCIAVYCSVLQCVAVRYGELQCVAVCCSAQVGDRKVLEAHMCVHVAECCSVVQCVTVYCSVLQCVAVRCGALQCIAVCCSVLQYPSRRQKGPGGTYVCACYGVLQYVAMCCSVLHYVAVTCSVV